MSTYQPSKKLRDALKAWEDSVELELERRHAARAAVAEELKETGAANSEVAPHTRWTEETIRGIAREYGVPHRRKPKTGS